MGVKPPSVMLKLNTKKPLSPATGKINNSIPMEAPMGKLVILQLLEGDFQRGFSCTVQISFDEGTLETRAQITGRLPANPDMPQKLNDEWRRAFNFNESSRIKAKQAGVTNFSQCNAVNNFVEYLNSWLNNSTDSEWQKIRDFLQQSLNKEEEIRVIIQTKDPILRRIPWQAWNLFAENYPSSEIALSPTTFATPGDLPPSNSNKVRILVVLGSSTVADGSQEIDITFDQQELEKLKQLGAFLKFLKQPDPQELRDCLWLEGGWDIFFFAGHSSSSLDGTVGEIILNNARAQGFKITELFEALKKAISRGLQLAIFNSCDGLGLANQLAELNIRQMIVMREPVPDAVAKTFLKHFLTALACNNKSLYASVREARSKLGDLNEEYPGAKYLPVICQNPTVIPPTWKKLRTGGRIVADWDINSHLSREEYQKRQVLLSKVRNFWVEGVLEKRLYDRVLLELGLEERLDAVNHPWGMVWETPNQLRQTLAPGTRVIDKFDEMAFCRTLLILGEPGSGKTITLLELARDLINRAEIDINQPIPVVFNLSSWGSEKLKQTIADWLVQELQRSYKVSKKYALFLMKSQKLLLILDGLDEVKERRNLCVQALNQFRQDYGETEIVIASRIRDYERLNYRLDLQSAIYLQPLTREQINHYFDSLGSQIATVRNLWQEDETLQELAKSPLMLNIMTLAYQGLKSEDLPIIDSIEGRRKHLFDKYIERMFQRRGGYTPSPGEDNLLVNRQNAKGSKVNKSKQSAIFRQQGSKKKRYKKEDSKRWLIWLAKRISVENKTIFLIEHIQPNSLHNTTTIGIFNILFLLMIGMITHLIICFFEFFVFKIIYLQVTAFFLKSSGDINLTLTIDELSSIFFQPIFFVIGFFLGICNLVISKFRRQEKIIPFEKITFSQNVIRMSFHDGSQKGIIPGIIIGLIISIYFETFLGIFDIFYFTISYFIGLILYLTMHLCWQRIIHKKCNILFIVVFLMCNFMLTFTSFIPTVNAVALACLLGGIINIIFGLRIKNVDITLFPNQGIWNSAKNVVLFALIAGLFFGFISAWISWVSHHPFVAEEHEKSLLYNIIMTSSFYGFIFALFPGFPVIKHFTLRVILYFKKYIPWNYARFLDYATERIFLQKVGGGYIFIHRLLQEHFASLKLD